MTQPAQSERVMDSTQSAAVVRTARRSWRCVNAHAHIAGNPAAAACTVVIMCGERYVEGDIDPYLAGGFGHDKLCLPCARAEGLIP